jgi:ribosome-binding protein aMBF1 (putative translation factor)
MSPTRRRRFPLGTPALEILDRITGDDPELRNAIRHQKRNIVVGQEIYAARVAAGLSQTQLAKLVRTTQSVISRLEDADYEAHSLTMLQRIADALHCRLEVRFVPEGSRKRRIVTT